MSKYILSFLATILLLASSYEIRAQIKRPGWEAGMSAVGGFGKQAPFWIISNRQGKFLPEKYAGSMELGIFAESYTGRVIDYDYGAELYGRRGGDGDLWLHQAYAGITFYNLVRVRAGMQEEVVGSKVPSLSTGSVIWSGNARPMPKIEISTPGYFSVPYTGGYLEMKGLISHGWFEEGRYASNVWLHHKNAYVRLGGSFPVNIYYGFNHYAMWGGSSPRQEQPYPKDFKSFIKVFFNRSGDKGDSSTPEGWAMNRYGNSLGSQNYGIELKIDDYSAGLYQQDVFEDGSGMRKRNFPDGLWGAWVRFTEEKKPLQAIVYEYLQTTSQSGAFHDVEGDTLGGNDNYFNHGHYKSGWTYYDYTIGTPIITSPVLNDPPSQSISNNRVVAHHLGFEGHFTDVIAYRNFFTFYRNFGTYSNPFSERRDQFSWMMEIVGPLSFFDLEAGVTLAADFGEMYGNNYGMVITLRRTGSFLGE
ncbi:MAG: capsule assembly Wzi family protein [Bacteroidales bacterium]